ncbi:Flp pilus assembly protein CpaB [Enterovirga sp. GCM10030262]|uniref:Flp pilus assembly protein CpaB n=1 Tax=Enterovirga sp. GCM10030262 TaxID=3273391 RepID=UPI00360F3F04
MDVKKIVLLIGALVIAAVTAVMARNMFTGAGAPSASATAVVPAGPEVLVSTRALPVGTIIDAEALRYQAWPEGLVQNAYYIKGEAAVNPADLLGTVVRTEITAGQPISQGALIKPGDRGFLAAALGPGMRAITVAVSATSGVAGFVFPGDRIDLVLTQEVPGGGDGPPLRASETIIRNIRVLATDQRMNVRNEEGKPVVKSVSTVTLEATPKIAEKIAVAQTIGQLSLSLRSLADNSAELEMAIASGEVEVPEGDDPNAEKRLLLAVAAKPTDKNTTYTLGADVSRFQRSTVPSKAAPIDGAGGAAVAGVPAAVPVGPIVRVARGNTVTVVPVGAK